MGGHFGTPFGGIPIPEWIHEQYSKELKDAWDAFHNWWVEQAEYPVSRKSMPENVAKAFELIKITPIPEYPEYTGADSCYVLGVESQLSE